MQVGFYSNSIIKNIKLFLISICCADEKLNFNCQNCDTHRPAALWAEKLNRFLDLTYVLVDEHYHFLPCQKSAHLYYYLFYFFYALNNSLAFFTANTWSCHSTGGTNNLTITPLQQLLQSNAAIIYGIIYSAMTSKCLATFSLGIFFPLFISTPLPPPPIMRIAALVGPLCHTWLDWWLKHGYSGGLFHQQKRNFEQKRLFGQLLFTTSRRHVGFQLE